MKRTKNHLQIVEQERIEYQEKPHEIKFNLRLKEHKNSQMKNFKQITKHLNQQTSFGKCFGFDDETNNNKNNRDNNMKNPSHKKLLHGLIDYIEDDTKRSSWHIICNDSYEATRIYQRQKRKERSHNSKRQNFKVYLEWLEMAQSDKSFEVDSYLKVMGDVKFPSNKEMLRDFINYLEDDSKRTSWRIISKAHSDVTRVTPRHKKQERSKHSKRQHFKVFLEWYEIGEDDLEYIIDSFLKIWDED